VVRQGWKSVTQVSARELVSRRYYPLFLASVFVASLLAAMLTTAAAEQTEEAIARRYRQPVFPAARPLVGWLAQREGRSA